MPAIVAAVVAVLVVAGGIAAVVFLRDTDAPAAETASDRPGGADVSPSDHADPDDDGDGDGDGEGDGRTIETTAPPTIADEPVDDTSPSAASGYEIGERFQATCTVAWPSAPSYTSRTIELTTTCRGVSSEFQFVQISYGDPDLEVTPSRSTMDVRGTIVEVAQSALGYRVLVVLADQIELR